jgi:ArsR family transcriptional regulator, arsenate/arsenite/antimonite-responsive transcriptional repressor
MAKVTDPDVALLQALAEPNRLAIMRKLAQEGEADAGDFTACCEVAQPTISHHLKVLREAGVVATSRRGTSIRYRLQPEAMRRLAALFGSLVPTMPATVNPDRR